jgi:hypothetical protein
MAELMQEHNTKQRQILDDIPRYRLISINLAHDLEVGDYKPGPMQINLDADDAKQRKGAGSGVIHRTTPDRGKRWSILRE